MMEFFDDRRVEICWMLSASLHLAAFGAYLKHHAQKAESLTILSEVEFIEPEPIRPEMPVPVEEKPLKVMDFLKLALPKLKPAPPMLQEEIKLPDKPKELLAPPPMEKIDLKKGLDSPSALDLEKKNLARSSQLTDMTMPETQAKTQISQLADAPLQLEEVGRAAVAPPPGFDQEMELRRRASSAKLQEQALPSPSTPRSASAGLREADIALARGASRPSAAPSAAQPSVSLSRGSQGLREAPVPSVKNLAAQTPAAAQKPTANSQITLEPSKKSVEISGPISSRKILKTKLPEYPAWAREKGISADVVLMFFVTPQGRIATDKTRVQKTSGYRDLDNLAMDALKEWIFEPIDQKEEQWGHVTFRYVLE